MVYFRCPKCDHFWKARAKRRDQSEVRCPECRAVVYTYRKSLNPPRAQRVEVNPLDQERPR